MVVSEILHVPSPFLDYDDLSFSEKCIHDTVVNDNGVKWNKLCQEAYTIYIRNPAFFDYAVWESVRSFTFRIHFIKGYEKPMAVTTVEHFRMLDNVTGCIIKSMREEIELGNHGPI